MDKLTALKALAEQVEAGKWDHSPNGTARQVFPYKSASIDDLGLIAAEAYSGSLDAAKALHDALLPDEGFEIFRTGKYPGMIPGSSPYAYGARVGYGTTYRGDSDNPARAWLLAILRALIAKEKRDD